MSRKMSLAALVAILVLSLAVVARAANVTVRVEGQKSTLVPLGAVPATAPAIDPDGDPSHSCAAGTAAAALQRATHGDWAGTWSEGLGYFVTTIKGEKHPGSPDYWAFWVNDKQASAGICQTQLHAGDRLLFFVDTCVYDAATQGCKNKPVLPLALRAPRHVRRGARALVRVVAYSAAGKPSPVKGAGVVANGRRVGRTNARGELRVTFGRRGTVRLAATKTGDVRSEVERVTVR